MKKFTLEQERARLENIAYAENVVKSCTRRHRIHDYIPGQATYNLGGYPSKFSIMPTEYDEECIKNLAEMGVGLIQVHEEWNDSIRVLGADKYSSHDPAGMRAFIELCHRYGIRILPYFSTAFIDVRDPDCRESFFTDDAYLKDVHFHYRYANAKSPEWCNFILEKAQRILDEYGFDGIYNDYGYAEVRKYQQWCRENGVEFRDDRLPYDPYAEDLVARLYGLCHERSGVLKLHIGKNRRFTSSEKLYDYLWVGENVKETSAMLMTAAYEPYVVPCPDYKWITEDDFEVYFARSLPFLQFPLRLDGRPMNDAKVKAPGVIYTEGPLFENYRRIGEYAAKHPEGPHVYSGWSPIPDNVNMRNRWAEYLKLYLPLVEDGNICHMDIKESALVKGALPQGVYMSLFTGCKQYLCVANLSETVQMLALEDLWMNCESGMTASNFALQPQRVCFLEKTAKG